LLDDYPAFHTAVQASRTSAVGSRYNPPTMSPISPPPPAQVESGAKRVDHADGILCGNVPYRFPVYIVFTLLALLTNFLLGKETAWDTLNYHLYAGFSAVNDRFGQDYFAAGPQGYFNPFAYVPFYEMVHAGLPALVIASVLAAAQSVILWITFELGVAVCPSGDPRMRFAYGVCAASLAFLNPILMQQIGSSFTDITTAELALGGWLLLASAVRAPRTVRVLCAGLILGAASALKLTNAVHAIAGFAVLVMLPLDLRGRVHHLLHYGLSLGLGFAILAAPWSYRLEQKFGNPLFPLMNSVFRSPEFTTASLRHFRFTPDTLADALWRPFAIVDPVNMVHEELMAPDLRYAVLVMLIAAFLLHRLWLRFGHSSTQIAGAKLTASTRVLMALGAGFTVDWILWLSGSGNSRYFLPMASIAAVAIVGLLFRLFAAQPKARNYILVVIFAVQAIQLWMGTQYRWTALPWGGPWFDIAVPQKLKTEPNLYLTMGVQSNSFIAPYLARDSGLVNFSGGYSFGSDGANGDRVRGLMGQYAPRLRVLLNGERIYGDAERHEPNLSFVNNTVGQFGLRVDMSDCATITVNGLPHPLEFTLAGSKPEAPAARDKTFLVSCHLIPDGTDHSARLAQQRLADLALDRLEDACPQLFQPRRPFTEYTGTAWARRYLNTDLTAWVSRGEVKFVQPIRGSQIVYVGHETDWDRAPMRLTCGRKDGIYFAKAQESNRGP
jgi:hypothetical protein